ncbi:MAG: hypothetical protein M3541_22180 [Acidobacteriota bacterium]|nr:hypothetical protein [Acidobacteriota bacterium]
MASATLAASTRTALEALAADLQRIFGNRLHSVCAYGAAADTDADIRSIALVQSLDFEDLAACVPLTAGWGNRGLAVPLLLERDEFRRTLDVFPLEYGEIIASHVVVRGDDPFLGLTVPDADRRRACELQAKSHLIHLREGFLETGGDPRRVARLIGASAEGFHHLLVHIVALVAPSAPNDSDHLPEAAEEHIGVPRELVREVTAAADGGPSTIADPTAMLARYIAAVERVWEFVDGWKRA